MTTHLGDDRNEAFARFILRHRWAVILCALAAVALCATGARHLVLTNSYRVFFNPDNPELMAFDAVQQTFSKVDNVMFVVAPQAGEVFTATTLKAIGTLTERAWRLPHASRVDSITNFQHTTAKGDDLAVGDLIPGAAPLDAPSITRIRRIALNEPLLTGNLVAADGKTTAVNVVIQLRGENEQHEVPQVASAARALAHAIEGEFPGLRVRLTGLVMMDNAFSEASAHDVETLVVASFCLMLVLVAVLMGGPIAGIGTACVVGLAIAAAMGIAGYLAYPVSPPISAAPVIILTVAIANCVHVLESFIERYSAGAERHAAIIFAVSTNLTPIFMASLTTVIGFLTFNFSDVPPFRQLGNIVAFGDLASYALAVTLLPALLAVLPLRRPAPRARRLRYFTRLTEFVIRRRRALLLGSVVVVLALLANLPRNRLNDVLLDYFDQTVQFRADSDFTIKHLTGLYHLQYALRAPASGGISEPGFLAAVDRFAAWLREQPEVVHVSAFSDTMKGLNRNMHGDDPAAYHLPESRELAAQYLLAYEMSLPFGLDLNNQINVDKSALRLTVAVRTLSSSAAIAFNQRAEDWVHAKAPAVASVEGTGTLMMFSHIGQRNIRSMLFGTAVALVLISVVLLVMLRSVKLGLVSLAPNLLPPALGFGLWGIIDGEITLALSVVTSMTLGIIIDDTVHFLVKYQRARRLPGVGPEDAVRRAYAEVGPAMFFTSLILMAGFLVLSLSHFALNAGMGLLTALIIGLALLLDLLFLSPLLLFVEETRHAPVAVPTDRPAES